MPIFQKYVNGNTIVPLGVKCKFMIKKREEKLSKFLPSCVCRDQKLLFLILFSDIPLVVVDAAQNTGKFIVELFVVRPGHDHDCRNFAQLG